MKFGLRFTNTRALISAKSVPLGRYLKAGLSSLLLLCCAQLACADNSLQIRMSGKVGGESVTLTVGGLAVRTWTLTAGMATYSATTTSSGAIRVAFTNDNGPYRDVLIDYVNINGDVRYAASQTEHTGYWSGTGCTNTTGNGWLHCNGYIGFGSAPAVVSSSVSSSSSSVSSSSLSSVSSAVSSAGSASSSASVADAGIALSLSDIPLESGLTPPANVLLVTDDSGSMDWEIVIAQDASLKEESVEVMKNGSNMIMRYPYLFGSSTDNKYDNYFGAHFGWFDTNSMPVAPFHATISSMNTFGYPSSLVTQMEGLWRLRNHNYNLIFYNPNTTYVPWPDFSNSNPASARVDPSISTKVANLTSATSNNLTWQVPTASSYQQTTGTVYLASYYTWASSGANDTYVDVGECGQLVEIKASATNLRCDGTAINSDLYFPFPKPSSRTDCSESGCTYAQEIQNFANWFTYYRRREFVAKAALATVVTDVVGSLDGIKVGYATINADDTPWEPGFYASGMPLKNVAKNSAAALREMIYKTKAGAGRTPLLTALDRSGRYFACQSGHIFENIVGGSSVCPRNNSAIDDPKYAACQQNYTVLMTDGFWIGDAADWNDYGQIITTRPSMSANHDADSASPFDGGAFADDNLGSGTKWLTLADVAMYFYKTDIAPAVSNKVRPTQIDKTRIVDPSYWVDTFGQTKPMHQHMKTYTIGLGVFNDNAHASIGGEDDFGNWIMPEPTDTVVWPTALERDVTDSNKVEDLKHAAYNGRGTYYKGNDAEMLSNNLFNVFRAIAQGEGAVGAVSFNSQRLSTDSVVYTASFDSQFNSGDVVAYRIDRDTGLISTDPANIVWRAATQLAGQVERNCNSPGDSRNILSYVRNGANSTGINLDAASGYLSPEQVNWLRGQLQDEAGSNCTDSFGFRARAHGLLGDIVHSRPLYLGKPTAEREEGAYASGTNAYQNFKALSYVRNRQATVMVGANDGMFHVFNADTGNEVFAYVPQRLLQGGDRNNRVSDLFDPSYSHQYYVDSSPVAEDVFIRTRSDNSRKWRTIVVAGYGAGGRGYFAADVSNMSDFSTQGGGVDNIMWEFSDLDDPRLGNTFSPPLLAMTNSAHTNTNEGNKWHAIVGNGYNSKDGVARLMLLDLEGAADGSWDSGDYTVINASSTPGSGEAKNGLSTPRGIDANGDGTVDYVYAGDLNGNVYRFDLTSTSGNYSVQTIFTARDAANKRQPISTQPLVMRHPDDNNAVVVVVATGKWLTRDDAESTDIQSIYGVIDYPSQAVGTLPTRAALQPRYIKNVALGTNIERVIEGAALNWSLKSGWYFDFAARAVGHDPDDAGYNLLPVVRPGERAIRGMVSRGGYIFVNTVYPNQASGCDPNLGGAVMAFNPLTGLVDKPIADFNGDGAFDTLNGENIAGLTTDNNLSDSAMIDEHLVVQMTDSHGVITPVSFLTDTSPDVRKGRLSWTQLK